MHNKKGFTLVYNLTANEYCLKFDNSNSDREHIFDRFSDVYFFLKSLGYVEE